MARWGAAIAAFNGSLPLVETLSDVRNSGMSTPLPREGRLEVRDASGQLVGYFVPATELDHLQAERDALKKVVDTLRPLPPMSDEELRQLMEGTHTSLGDIIAELEGASGANDHQ